MYCVLKLGTFDKLADVIVRDSRYCNVTVKFLNYFIEMETRRHKILHGAGSSSKWSEATGGDMSIFLLLPNTYQLVMYNETVDKRWQTKSIVSVWCVRYISRRNRGEIRSGPSIMQSVHTRYVSYLLVSAYSMNKISIDPCGHELFYKAQD